MDNITVTHKLNVSNYTVLEEDQDQVNQLNHQLNHQFNQQSDS
jgi:hypothetical protein